MGELPVLSLLSVVAYTAGSVNVSILLFRITGRADPRLDGSGNPGATNVFRQAGLGWAAAVLLLDMGRAMTVAALARWQLPPGLVPWVGLGLILGNRFPCFHGFRGGKGIANYLGFTLIIAPLGALIGGLAWGAAFAVWRTPFIASFAMLLCLAAGTLAVVGVHGPGAIGVCATVLFIVACHHRNIRQRWFLKSVPLGHHEDDIGAENQSRPGPSGRAHGRVRRQQGPEQGRQQDPHRGEQPALDGGDVSKTDGDQELADDAGAAAQNPVVELDCVGPTSRWYRRAAGPLPLSSMSRQTTTNPTRKRKKAK